MSPLIAVRPFLALLAASVLLSQTNPPSTWAAPPDEGDCPTAGGDAKDPLGRPALDAAPILLKEGMLLDHEALLALRSLLPPEVWQYREIFFHEGMQMEIGPCHRRYPVPGFFSRATEKFAGRSHLNEKGDLALSQPGLPFPPDLIDLEAPDAAAKWAWNLQRRYRGAALRGNFRLTDLPGRIGGIQVYEGDFFMIQLQNRTDFPKSDYRAEDAENKLWGFGGRFTEPFNARHLAWRQFRLEGSLDSWEDSDDIFVYVPEMRKMRRAASTWVDGTFLPHFSVSMGGAGGGLVFGSGSAINPTAGQSIAVSQAARTGFTGLALRPNAYVWRTHGEQDVLAPIDSNRVGYPENPNRNFGNSGLSLASDRWDVRRVVVIEGAARRKEETIRTLTIYVDYQTQLPLYWITRTDRRRLVEIGILAHRFSGSVPNYENWPDSTPADVFDPVVASFFNALDGVGGWRRESYDLRSTPVPPNLQRRMNSIEMLDRGN